MVAKDTMNPAQSDVVAVIMARGGSKGVPKKNIRKVGGYPLIAYSVVACTMSREIGRTIVSTDSEEIAEIARGFGAEVPFMRPAEYATDTATDYDVLRHAHDWLSANGDEPDYLVQIRPTTPLRVPEVIDDAIRTIKERPDASGLVSVHETQESPCKMFGLDAESFLLGLCPNDPRPEYFNLPRQAFPKTYFGNGFVDVVKSTTLVQTKTCYGRRMLGFVTPNFGEIDRPEDFDLLEFFLERKTFAIYDHLKRNFQPS